jgi:hypothetical protein
MTEDLAFMIDGVQVIPRDADGSAFVFVPGDPIPERTSAGPPTLILLQTGNGATLQFGTHWDVAPKTVATIRARIAKTCGIDESAVALDWPAMMVDDVVLELHSSEGVDTTTLATAKSSQFPPYAAVFNVNLTAEQAATVKSALNGSHGVLFVTYRAVVLSPRLPNPVVRSTDVASWYAGSDAPTIIKAP